MKQINVLVVGNSPSFVLNKLSHNSYVPKLADHTVHVWDKKVCYIFFEEVAKKERDVIFMIVRKDANKSQLHKAKNHLLKLYVEQKCPICVVYIDRGVECEFSFAERNKIMQIHHLKRVMVCALNFNNKECQTRITEILKWIARFANQS